MPNTTEAREALIAELLGLATQMMRDSWATGNDAAWQPGYQALESRLRAALSQQPAGDGEPETPSVHLAVALSESPKCPEGSL